MDDELMTARSMFARLGLAIRPSGPIRTRTFDFSRVAVFAAQLSAGASLSIELKKTRCDALAERVCFCDRQRMEQ